jgi:hypothetical protein
MMSGPLPLKFFYFDCIECQVSLVCYNSGGGKKKQRWIAMTPVPFLLFSPKLLGAL